MNKIFKLIRQDITANTLAVFNFDVKGYEYLVKNFNDFPIYVAFETIGNDRSKTIKIPEQSAQICTMNKSGNLDNTTDTVYVIAEDAGEVEVQCVRY